MSCSHDDDGSSLRLEEHNDDSIQDSDMEDLRLPSDLECRNIRMSKSIFVNTSSEPSSGLPQDTTCARGDEACGGAQGSSSAFHAPLLPDDSAIFAECLPDPMSLVSGFMEELDVIPDEQQMQEQNEPYQSFEK